MKIKVEIETWDNTDTVEINIEVKAEIPKGRHCLNCQFQFNKRPKGYHCALFSRKIYLDAGKYHFFKCQQCLDACEK